MDDEEKQITKSSAPLSTEKDSPRPPTQEEINVFYERFMDQIVEWKDQEDNSDKYNLYIVGETHDQQEMLATYYPMMDAISWGLIDYQGVELDKKREEILKNIDKVFAFDSTNYNPDTAYREISSTH